MRSLWLPLVFLTGCACPLSEAVSAFEAGKPDEAIEQFRALEHRFDRMSVRSRVDYALYLGLTQLSLGNAHEADRWLSWVKRCADREPSLLTDAEYGRLIAAFRSMGHMPGER